MIHAGEAYDYTPAHYKRRGSGIAVSVRVAESISERENLPDELEPEVTYRDFAVRWRLAARLEDPPHRASPGT